MIQTDTFSITYVSQKRKVSDLPFLAIKNHILGQKYDLSLVFAPKKMVTEFNVEYRDKEYTPNILSFPYTKTSGEIFIHLPTAKKQAPDFEMDFETYLVFLFIHGCLHLKGSSHSSTMERKERQILQKLYLDTRHARQK